MTVCTGLSSRSVTPLNLDRLFPAVPSSKSVDSRLLDGRQTGGGRMGAQLAMPLTMDRGHFGTPFLNPPRHDHSLRFRVHPSLMSASPTCPTEQITTASANWNDKLLREDEIATPNGIERFFVPSNHGHIFTTNGSVEPSSEPCTDDIPWDDLVYWLGNSTTGEVACECEICQFERKQGRVPVALVGQKHPREDEPNHGHYVYIPSTFYKRLSAMIPVIAVPRIEGLN